MRQAHIRVTGRIGGETEEVLDFSCEGTVSEENGTVVISYEETVVSGMEGTQSVIYISDDVVTLNRMGTVSSTLMFVQGSELTAETGIAEGSLRFPVYTERIDFKRTAHNLLLTLEYVFNLGGEATRNVVTVACDLL